MISCFIYGECSYGNDTTKQCHFCSTAGSGLCLGTFDHTPHGQLLLITNNVIQLESQRYTEIMRHIQLALVNTNDMNTRHPLAMNYALGDTLTAHNVQFLDTDFLLVNNFHNVTGDTHEPRVHYPQDTTQAKYTL